MPADLTVRPLAPDRVFEHEGNDVAIVFKGWRQPAGLVRPHRKELGLLLRTRCYDRLYGGLAQGFHRKIAVETVCQPIIRTIVIDRDGRELIPVLHVFGVFAYYVLI